MKPPKDPLELGRHLVRELGLADSTDTLERWMAHHVAELIDEAEKAPTKTARLKARAHATEVILKIWEHRTTLPGESYPLARYKDVVRVLQSLRPANNPFRRLRDLGRREEIAADILDNLSNLVMVVLLSRLVPSADAAKPSNVASAALSEAEQDVLRELESWGRLTLPAADSPEQTQKGTGDEVTREKIDKVALQRIEVALASLRALKGELAGTTKEANGPAGSRGGDE